MKKTISILGLLFMIGCGNDKIKNTSTPTLPTAPTTMPTTPGRIFINPSYYIDYAGPNLYMGLIPGAQEHILRLKNEEVKYKIENGILVWGVYPNTTYQFYARFANGLSEPFEIKVFNTNPDGSGGKSPKTIPQSPKPTCERPIDGRCDY